MSSLVVAASVVHILLNCVQLPFAQQSFFWFNVAKVANVLVLVAESDEKTVLFLVFMEKDSHT